MPGRTHKKITQTRNILIVVIVVCAAKLAKLIMDGGAQTAQIVVLAAVIVVLGVILALYILLERYVQNAPEDSGQTASLPDTPPAPAEPAPGLKAIFKEIFKKT